MTRTLIAKVLSLISTENESFPDTSKVKVKKYVTFLKLFSIFTLAYRILFAFRILVVYYFRFGLINLLK